MTTILAFLHFISIIALASLLVVEFLMFRVELNPNILKLLKKIDTAYGIAALCVIITGVIRIFTEKGWAYYSTAEAFHAKITFFVIMGILSIYPTVKFAKLNPENGISDPEKKKIRKLLHIQLVLIPIIVLCAVIMARGFY